MSRQLDCVMYKYYLINQSVSTIRVIVGSAILYGRPELEEQHYRKKDMRRIVFVTPTKCEHQNAVDNEDYRLKSLY